MKGAQQRPSGPGAMTSPAGAISGAQYRGASWTPSYAPTQQAYRYSAPLSAQPAYAYTTTQHTTTTVSFFFLLKNIATLCALFGSAVSKHDSSTTFPKKNLKHLE